MRRAVAATLVGAGAAAFIVSGSVNAAVTLDDLINGPNKTITVGDKIFGDFSLTSSCPIDLTSVNVTASEIVPNSHYALSFQGPFVAVNGASCDWLIQYTVQVAQPPPVQFLHLYEMSLGITPNLSGGGGIVSVGETVWDTFFGVGNNLGHANVSLGDVGDPLPEATDVLTWDTYQTKIWVQKDIFVSATPGVNSLAGVSSIVQDFHQHVPEPAQCGLMFLAAAGIGAYLKKRSA